MNKKFKVAILIPCFNEGLNIMNLYNETTAVCLPSSFELFPIFINDCSSDNTLEILIKNKISYLNLINNLGIGGAVQAGYKYALHNGFEIAVQMDGDGQHPPSELIKILMPFLNDEADVVIGSRYITKEGFQSSFLRRTGINYFKSLNYFLTGIKINDSTSGYRAINLKGLKIVTEYYPDEYPEPETILLFAANNLKIKEVSVIMRERQGGGSSIKSYKTIYYVIKVSLNLLSLYFKIKLKKPLNG